MQDKSLEKEILNSSDNKNIEENDYDILLMRLKNIKERITFLEKYFLFR